MTTTAASSGDFLYRDPEHARQLRERVRHLIAEQLPEGWLGPFTNNPADIALSNKFCETLASESLLVPDWPTEYGGQDADLACSIVMREEMWSHFEPRGAQYYNPNWIGPSILHYGTAEQKALHLPRIAAGKAIWCQGFSEPDAGSDLAALRTQAVPDGDGFRITGQKIWTSWALWAQWCYLLARVQGFGEDRRDGITVFLIPMDREGITVRGLDGIPGPHHLNEVFFDNVWVERAEVLGEIGKGWQVIRDALSKERVGIARYARGDRLLARVIGDESYRQALPGTRWAQARVRNRMARLMCRRALQLLEDEGGAQDFVVSAARMITTRADLLAADAVSEAIGDRFFEDRYTSGAAIGGAAEFFWRYMQAGTIASGTTEMLQRQLSRSMFKGERIRVTEDAAEIRDSFDKFVSANGGVDCARQAIADPGTRAGLLAGLGNILAELDPRNSGFEGLAAAEVCRSAGRSVLPVPIEPILLRRPGGIPLGLLSPGGRLEHSDLFPEWDVQDAGGATVRIATAADRLSSKVGHFVNKTPVQAAGATEPLSATERALLLALPSWYVLGALEEALDLATRYATQRVAFGSPISAYQGVAFQLADACAELQALYELALATMWSIYESPATARVDSLALRWATLDIARRTLRACHQVMGAIGLCDEHDLTVITLSLQPRLRLPGDLEASAEELARAIEQDGFDSLFTPVA